MHEYYYPCFKEGSDEAQENKVIADETEMAGNGIGPAILNPHLVPLPVIFLGFLFLMPPIKGGVKNSVQ